MVRVHLNQAIDKETAELCKTCSPDERRGASLHHLIYMKLDPQGSTIYSNSRRHTSPNFGQLNIEHEDQE